MPTLGSPCSAPHRWSSGAQGSGGPPPALPPSSCFSKAFSKCQFFQEVTAHVPSLLTKPRLSPRSNWPICSFCSFETLPVSAPRARPQSTSSPAPGSLVPLVLPVARAHGHSWACWAVTGPLCHQASPSTRLPELSSLGHLLGLLSQCRRLILVTEFSPSSLHRNTSSYFPETLKKKKSGHILKI